MSGSLDKKQEELCKVEEITGNNPSDIEDEINVKLAEGWGYADVFTKANKVYIIFIR